MNPPAQQTHWRWKFLCLYGVFTLLLLVGVIVVVEAGVRMFVPEKYWRFRVSSDDWLQDDELGWVNIPNLDVENREGGKTLVRFQTNKDGLQPASAKEEKSPGKLRVMIFGDSAVVGRAVPAEQRLLVQLERAMAAKGVACEVICAGVQGYSNDQELLAIRKLLPRYHPDVVINMVCDNDFGGNQTGVAFGHPKPRYVLQTDGTLKYEPPVFETVPDAWKKTIGHSPHEWMQHLALFRILSPGLQRLRAASDWRQANLMGMGAELPALMSQVDWRLFDSIIAAMKAECDANGAAFVLTQHPHIYEVWGDPQPPENRYAFQRQMERAAHATGVNYSPVIDSFLRVRNEGPFHLLPRDPHCNGKGYKKTAEILATYLTSAKPGLLPVNIDTNMIPSIP